METNITPAASSQQDLWCQFVPERSCPPRLWKIREEGCGRCPKNNFILSPRTDQGESSVIGLSCEIFDGIRR